MATPAVSQWHDIWLDCYDVADSVYIPGCTISDVSQFDWCVMLSFVTSGQPSWHQHEHTFLIRRGFCQLPEPTHWIQCCMSWRRKLYVRSRSSGSKEITVASIAVPDFLLRIQKPMTNTSCPEEEEDEYGQLKGERCADDGPFQERFLQHALVFAHCEYLPRCAIQGNLLHKAGWYILRAVASCECTLFLPIVEITCFFTNEHVDAYPVQPWKQVSARSKPMRSEDCVKCDREDSSERCCAANSSLQNKTALRCSWEKHCAVLQIIYRPRSIEGSRMIRKYPWKKQICPVPDVFVSEEQRLKCVEIKVPSPSKVSSTAWIRIPPPPDRMYPGQPDSARRGIGRPIALQSQISARERNN